MLEYLVILFLSPLIFLFVFTVPQYLWSIFQKPRLDAYVNKLYSNNPEITLVEKLEDGKRETEILIKNFRNVKYNDSEWDNEISWENKKYNFSDLNNLEILLDHYAVLQSHIIVIFNFIDEFNVCKKLCISYEPKKKETRQFSAFLAMYKNFEAGYIVGSYEDIVGVRFLRYNNFKHTEVANNIPNLKHYKLNFTQAETQTIFLSMVNDINLYSKKAFFYNFIYRNCLSEILKHWRKSGRFAFTSFDLLSPEKLLGKNNII